MAEVCPLEPLVCPIPGQKEAGDINNPNPDAKLSEQKRKELIEVPVKAADAIIIYVLGSINNEDGTTTVQLDEYSGLNGAHIRTIPKERWSNPILIAAGANLLAVVDRFADSDLIRVTDKYAGAGPSGFDTDGFPSTTITWGGVQDILISYPPNGHRVIGMTILTNGILIATLDDGSGLLKYWKADPFGAENNGSEFNVYTGLNTFIGKSEAQIGTPLGQIGHLGSIPEDNMFSFASLFQDANGKNSVGLIDSIENKVTALQGLPSGFTPISIVETKDILTVGLAQNDIITKVLRFTIRDDSFIAGEAETRAVSPDPDSYQVTKSFNPKDINRDNVTDYMHIVTALNQPKDPTNEIFDPGSIVGVDEVNSIVANDNLEQIDGAISVDFYEQTLNIPYSTIDIASSLGFKSITGIFGTLVVLLNRYDETGSIDVTKPIFRLLHAGHFDFLGDGGFTYGCINESGNRVGMTNGLIGTSIAVDKSYEAGKLKAAPDAKALLIDAVTGLIVYRDPKPKGYKVYSGDYASLNPNSVFKTTSCGTVQDTIATTLDGILRPDRNPKRETIADGNGDFQPIAAFSDSDLDYDFPWEFFKRQPISKKTFSLSPIKKTWTIRDNNDHILPEWRNLTNPVSIQKSSKLFWKPNGSGIIPPTFIATATGGFFFLNYQKEDIGTSETPNWQIPEAITNISFIPLSKSPTQVIDPITGGTIETVLSFTPPLDPWTIDTVGETVPGNRACIADFDIRSWIGVELNLTYNVSVSDGVDIFLNDTYTDNGLGLNAGASKIDYTAFNNTPIGKVTPASPGSLYEAGFIASPFGGEAFGKFEIDIFINGRKAESVATRVFNLATLNGLAPTEAYSALAQTFEAGGTSEPGSYHRGRVYYSPEVAKDVQIRVRLVNYATVVHRVGFETWNIAHGFTVTCAGADPGYMAGNSCTAANCGNVICGSIITGLQNKLTADDPVYPVTRQVLWEGTASYIITDNPYETEGLQVGNLINAYFEFNLNARMAAYRIDIGANFFDRN